MYMYLLQVSCRTNAVFLGAKRTMKSQANMSRFPKDPEMRAKMILMFVIRR